MKKIILALCTLLPISACAMGDSERLRDEIQYVLNTPDYIQDPPPAVGKFASAYTADFAKTYNLSEEGIDTSLSPGLAYIEMDVLANPYDTNRPFCYVNMLIDRPNNILLDYPLYIKYAQKREGIERELAFNSKRVKIKLNNFKINKTQFITANSGASFDYYSPDAQPNYDYFSSNLSCSEIKRLSFSNKKQNYVIRYVLNSREKYLSFEIPLISIISKIWS